MTGENRECAGHRAWVLGVCQTQLSLPIQLKRIAFGEELLPRDLLNPLHSEWDN